MNNVSITIFVGPWPLQTRELVVAQFILLSKLQSKTLQYSHLIFTISSLNGQLSEDRQKINQISS